MGGYQRPFIGFLAYCVGTIVLVGGVLWAGLGALMITEGNALGGTDAFVTGGLAAITGMSILGLAAIVSLLHDIRVELHELRPRGSSQLSESADRQTSAAL